LGRSATEKKKSKYVFQVYVSLLMNLQGRNVWLQLEVTIVSTVLFDLLTAFINFHLPCSNHLLVISFKLQAQENFRTGCIFLFTL